MTANLSTHASAYPRISKALGLALVSILAVVLLVGSGALPVNGSASTQFDNVQVFIQTSQDLPYSYTLTAYNTSGYQVAYYQSNFAAAALELPSGTYLFTVQASYGQTNYPCIGCVSPPMIPANSTAVTNPTSFTSKPAKILLFNDAGPMIPANSTTGSNTTGVTVVPIFRISSSNEYGYAVEQIAGPSTVTIDTQNASALPTSQVTVHVDYTNGTAAQGAWVYASVVDDSYYYGSNIVAGVQTGANGTAVLTMPQAPLLVTSDLSVPITLPGHLSNYTVIVGGQKVNVTINWQPSSINLEGQTLILPPQTSGDITLQYQPQQYFYPMPVTSSGSSGAPGTTITQTVTASTTSAGQNPAKARIPSFSPSIGQLATPLSSLGVISTVTAKGPGSESLLLVGVVAAMATALVAFTLVVVTARGKSKPTIVSA